MAREIICLRHEVALHACPCRDQCWGAILLSRFLNMATPILYTQLESHTLQTLNQPAQMP